jgi:ATP-dependent DNA ligase
MLLPQFHPLALERAPAPFSHPDWLFEIKWDGFGAVARIDHGRCQLISRKGNEFKSFKSLSTCFGETLQAQSAILDGEIVCVDDHGKPQFYDLLMRRREARFVAFDLLRCNGQDLRYSPLIERKHKLRSILPKITNEFSTAIMSKMLAKNCFSLPVRMILKASSQRGNSIRICLSTRNGSKFGTLRTHNGKAGKNYLSENAKPILI